MNELGRWTRKVAVLLRRNQFSGELDEEMAFHREQIEQELRAEGVCAKKRGTRPHASSETLRGSKREAAT